MVYSELLFNGLLVELFNGMPVGLFNGMIVGLFNGMIVGLFNGMFVGLFNGILPVKLFCAISGWLLIEVIYGILCEGVFVGIFGFLFTNKFKLVIGSLWIERLSGNNVG